MSDERPQGHRLPRRPEPPSGPGNPHTSGQRFGSTFGESWREHEFAHGQQQYYGDLVRPEAPASPAPAKTSEPAGSGRGRRTALLVAGVLVGVAVLGGGGYALYRSTQGTDRATGDVTPSPTASTAPTPTAGASSASGPGLGVQPLVRGWQVDLDTDDAGNKAAFDVPPRGRMAAAGVGATTDPVWDVSTSSQEYAGYFYAKAKTPGGLLPKAIINGHRPAGYRTGFCAATKNQNLASVVFQTSGDRDPADIAPDLAGWWSRAAALKSDDRTYESSSSVTSQQVAVNGGRTLAVRSRATVTHSERRSGRCFAPVTEVVVTSFTTGNGTASVVLTRDLGVPNALDDTTTQRILDSVRPVP
ncbi:hypothetical protein PZ938_04960 [Luteipulveratus sp. YIM 133132]|uniref:hypothetical protein n=1 Tax=Luteipulveratus flavus TaxID=3031728 RepID=UPI0023AE7040|nr:hypothetical protein [Luteipulveratus sp. YIM 133132]MDE9364948.1 hypothetical protein [Luteipulveratus sp. YIM 133132]